MLIKIRNNNIHNKKAFIVVVVVFFIFMDLYRIFPPLFLDFHAQDHNN